MAYEQNLKPVKSKDEARELGRKGGLASGQKRREKKTMSSLATMMINAQLSGENKAKIKKQFGILEDDDITIASAMMAGQIKAAMAGDSKSFNAVTSLIEKQEAKDEKEEAERLAKLHKTYHMDLDMIPDSFHAVIRDIRNEKHQES